MEYHLLNTLMLIYYSESSRGQRVCQALRAFSEQLNTYQSQGTLYKILLFENFKDKSSNFIKNECVEIYVYIQTHLHITYTYTSICKVLDK